MPSSSSMDTLFFGEVLSLVSKFLVGTDLGKLPSLTTRAHSKVREVRPELVLNEALLSTDLIAIELRGSFTITAAVLREVRHADEIFVLGRACKNIRVLDLAGCEALDTLPVDEFRNLCELDLSRCSEIDELPSLEVCEKLDTLRFSDNFLDDITGIDKCKKLKTLDLDKSSHLMDLDPLVNCHELSSLSLSHCDMISSLAPLVRCKNLRELSLGSERKEDFPDILCLALSTTLEELRLESYPFPDASKLAHFKLVRQVDLSCSTKLVDIAGLSGCVSMEALTLFACTGISDVSPLQHCRRLAKLDIGTCSNVREVLALAGCPFLTSVELSHCMVNAGMTGLAALDVKIVRSHCCSIFCKSCPKPFKRLNLLL